jgi:hypothetical protein
MFGARIEVVVVVWVDFFCPRGQQGAETMKLKVKTTTGRSSESIEPTEKKKRPYRPPRSMILTSDQARIQLTERALPGEAATQHLLAAISRHEPTGENKQRSSPGKAKGAAEK